MIAGNDIGRIFDMPQGSIMIGRGTQCDFVLADLSVSRKHVALTFDANGCMLLDQGSGNGTKVNGVRISNYRLVDGDEVELGKTVFKFIWAGAPSPIPSMAPAPAPAPAPAQVRPQPAPIQQQAAPVYSYPSQPGVPAPSTGGSSFTEQVDPLGAGIQPAPDLSPPTGRVIPKVGLRAKVFDFLGKLTNTRPKKILVIGGLAVLFLLLVLAMASKLKGKPKKKKAAVTQPAGPTQEQLYEQGKQLIRQLKWEEARRVFLKLAEKEPENPFIKTKLNEIKKNEEAQKYLQNAQKAFEAKELNKVSVLLSLIDKKEAPYYYAEGQKLLRKVSEKKADLILAQAQLLKGKKKKKEEALSLVGQALKLAPDYYPALLLRFELGGGPKPEPPKDGAQAPPTTTAVEPQPQPPETRAVAEAPTPSEPEKDKPRDRSSHSSSSSPREASVSASGSHKQAMAFYRARNWSAAQAELRRVAASQRGKSAKKTQALAGKVSSMSAAFKKGEAAQHSNALAAMNAYRKAYSLDKSLGGAHSSYLRAKLAKVSKAAAGSAFSSGNYTGAYRAVQVAQQFGAGGSVAHILSQLDNKAKALFNQGYVVRDTNLSKAKSLWRRVLSMVPSSSTWHKKAKYFLNNYGKAKPRKSGGSDEDEL